MASKLSASFIKGSKLLFPHVPLNRDRSSAPVMLETGRSELFMSHSLLKASFLPTDMIMYLQSSNDYGSDRLACNSTVIEHLRATCCCDNDFRRNVPG